jgi:lupus La protein
MSSEVAITAVESLPAAADVAVPTPAVVAPAAVAVSGAVSEDTLGKLRTQIEFYFSDANFRRDKFLRAKASEDADGFVGLDVIATFNRVKSITTDPATLASALDDSAPLELSEDRLAVRRAAALPEVDDSEARSVVAKAPFPVAVTLEKLQEWAAQWGPVARLVMRRTRTKEKAFRGSCIIEYFTHEGSAALVAAHADSKCLFEGAPVARIETLKGYYARKKAQREERKAKAGGKGAAAGSASAQTAAATTAAAAAAITRKRPNRDAAEVVDDEDENAPKAGAEGEAHAPRAFEKKLTPGVILRLSNLGQSASIDSLQLFLNSLGELKFAEYDPVTRTANARFESAGESLV